MVSLTGFEVTYRIPQPVLDEAVGQFEKFGIPNTSPLTIKMPTAATIPPNSTAPVGVEVLNGNIGNMLRGSTQLAAGATAVQIGTIQFVRPRAVHEILEDRLAVRDAKADREALTGAGQALGLFFSQALSVLAGHATRLHLPLPPPA